MTGVWWRARLCAAIGLREGHEVGRGGAACRPRERERRRSPCLSSRHGGFGHAIPDITGDMPKPVGPRLADELARPGSPRLATLPVMPPDDAAIANLVSALLAVNFYPVDRAYSLMPAFRERGLLDPAKVAAIPHAELIAAMTGAGYARGGYVPIISFRLYSLMEAVSSGALDSLVSLAAAGKKGDFVSTLSGVPGFGPSTASTAWQLFGATPGR